MSDLTPEEMIVRLRARADAAVESMGELSRIIGRYWHELVDKQGVPSEAAVELCRDLQAEMLESADVGED